MSISCACSSVSGSSCRRIWIDPDIDASGLRISWAMPAAISPTAASRCCTRASRSSLRDSVTSWNVSMKPVSPRGVISGAVLKPSSICRPSRAREAVLDARQLAAAPPPARTVRRAPPAAAARPPRRCPIACRAGQSGDRLGGTVEGQHLPVDVGRRQAARQAVDDVLAERLEVRELARRPLQLRVRAAQPFGQVAAQRRHRQEPEDVQADGEERDPQRRQVLRDRPRPAAPASRSTAASTSPA